ncbi:MAG: hypothetical protein OXE46_08650 [Chloroflexi bacterium]|nr:hypothetical protein [Chloroflexota bacterium]
MIFGRFVTAFGIGLALFGLLLDYILPSIEPGIGLPQLLIVALGTGLALVGWLLRRGEFRRRLIRDLRANLGKSALIALFTVVALEFGLTLVGYATYYPVEPPKTYLEIVDWFGCDAEMGCRYQVEAARSACEAGELAGLHCVFNSLGFADNDEFVASEDLAQRNRVLALGDSFTQGYSADVGYSFVATIEKMLPEIALWNLGIHGTSTNQALASFDGIAPIMQPHLTLLGFYVGNDFIGNRWAFDKRVTHNQGGRKIVRSMSLVLEGRWGRLYEVDAQTLLGYSHINVNPPPNELERLIGLTRLGAILLRSMDAVSPYFEGIKWHARVAATRDVFQQLHAATAAMESEFLVLLIPASEDHANAAPSKKFTTALNLMRELGIPHVNPYDALDADIDFNDGGSHWNNSGHGKVGMLLAECIDAFFAAGSLSACDQVVMP